MSDSQSLPEHQTCHTCISLVDSLLAAQQACASLERVPPVPEFPVELAKYKSAMESTVRGNFAQAKREAGWKLHHLKSNCAVDSGQCALKQVVLVEDSTRLNNDELQVTGLSPYQSEHQD